ncbi:MAG TPA: hypothetical protein PLJ84_06125 [Bacteroidales bacterium]|nr:hypothetical protein [Bacteroidales bacterium]HPT02155.1 hypothetical protein [Bacteroidales bacterium]
MKRFSKDGLLIIPVPEKKETESKNVIVIRECYCQNGHSLISNRIKFGEFEGLLVAVEKGSAKGLIALSPVYGEKYRVSIDIGVEEGELLTLKCPECGAKLQSYGPCSCGGELVVMFTKPVPDFNYCIGICNRVGCPHSEIKNEGQLMALTLYDSL